MNSTSAEQPLEQRPEFLPGGSVAHPGKELTPIEQAFLKKAETGSEGSERVNPEKIARGSIFRRILSSIFMLPAWFAPHARLRTFFHRMRGVRIGKDVEIGYFCIIGNVHPHKVLIEERAVVAAGSVLLDHDNAYYYAREGEVKFGPVVIKKGSFVGVKSVIMPNVTIGERSIVGANSLVLHSVPPDTVVGGVPARKIKDLGDQRNCC